METERLAPLTRGATNVAAPAGPPLRGLFGAGVGIAAVGLAVAGPGAAALTSTLLGWWLLWLAAVDLRHLVLPDRLTLPLLAAGIIAVLVLHPDRIADHLIGAATGYLLFRLVEALFRKIRGYEGLGRGDAKLLAAGGAWIAWYGLPSVILIASLVGIVQALLSGRLRSPDEARRPLPFGPALAFAIWFVWLFGPLQWRGLW